VARGYALSPFTATRSVSNFDGGGLPPSPVAGIVNIQVGDKTVQQQFCIGCGGSSGAIGGDAKSGFGISNPNKTVPMSPRRTYWYKR
jgi:type IV pilus assembly protein PilY1